MFCTFSKHRFLSYYMYFTALFHQNQQKIRNWYMHIRRSIRQNKIPNQKKTIKVLFHLTSKVNLQPLLMRIFSGSSTCISPKILKIWSDGLLVFQHFLQIVQILKMQNSEVFFWLYDYEPLWVQSLTAIRSEFTYSVVVATLVFWVNRSTDMYSLIINLSRTTLAKRRQRAKLLTSIN